MERFAFQLQHWLCMIIFVFQHKGFFSGYFCGRMISESRSHISRSIDRNVTFLVKNATPRASLSIYTYSNIAWRKKRRRVVVVLLRLYVTTSPWPIWALFAKLIYTDQSEESTPVSRIVPAWHQERKRNITNSNCWTIRGYCQPFLRPSLLRGNMC